MEISRTVGCKSISRCSKNPLLLIKYFKFWNPSVFSKPAAISRNVNSKLLRVRTLQVVLNACTACVTSWSPVSIVEGCLHSRPFFVCLELCNAVVNMFYVSQLSCTKICRTAGYRNVSRSSEISWSWYSWALYVDLTDLLACGVMKLLSSRWCLLCIIRLGHSPNESYWCEKTESEVK